VSVRLKDVVATNRKTLPETTDPDFSFRYIDISAVSQGRIDVPDEDLRFETAPSRARRLAEPGDTVVSTVRTYLRAVARVPKTPDPLVFSTGFAVLHPIADRIDSRYLSYYCTSAPFIDSIVARSVGVSYPAINASEVADVRLGLPPLDEQRRIADFLDTETTRIGNLVKAREAQSVLLSEMTGPLLSQVLSCAGAKQVPLRYLSRIVDTEHRTAPVVIGGGHWIVGTSAVREGSIVVESLSETDSSTYAEWTRRAKPQPGDVLLSREAPVGQVGRVPEGGDPLAIGQRMVLIKPAPGVLDGAYLTWVLQSQETGLFIQDLTQGSLHPHLNMSDIGRVPVPWRPIAQQTQVAGRADAQISRIRDTIRRLAVSNTLLDERRRALITAAVTGQLDVTTARGIDTR